METTTEWGNLCSKLLQEPLFRDESPEPFENLIIWQQKINEYMAVIGLTLQLNVDEGYAFLMENEDAEGNVVGGNVRLLRKSPLTYEQSLLLVLLRDELDKFEMSKSTNLSLIMQEQQIAELMEPYYPNSQDKVKYADLVSSLLSSLAQMYFIKSLHNPTSESLTSPHEREFEIRTIIRAKITTSFLTEFKTRLKASKEEINARK
ncbi:DUF4194 domain-containing protein [uncultured Sphaerochaeta sp.]|uniref:DUF4194 domain-containing protein n=1 Tax=uncultured Sphaerochaeta sp. TaxID=886478 RepID=UPI002A0A95AD|nr:DUF4194 domain-containing protein [uncultured Sphaerochaeta sp.]